jgi:hypothetical protein
MVARPTPSQRQVRRRLAPFVATAAATPGADRYRKRFPALAHLWVLLLHVLWYSPSLRVTHARLTSSPVWWQRWGMCAAISLSQLARSSTSRPAVCAETLLDEVLAAVRRQAPTEPLARLLQRTAAVDSTFVRLSATLSPWSVHGGFAPGVRLQGLVELGREVPERLRLTLADVNDHTALMERDLTPWRGWTLLFDLGYYGHRSFARLRAAGVHFVTRLNQQATYTVTAVRAVPLGATPDGDVILRDWMITLGSPNNRRGAVVPGLRLVSTRNRQGEVHDFLTSRLDLCVTEVVMLYRRRWRIELFFRWLKRQLGLVRPLGHTRAAVWLTVLLVLIVAVLVLLFAMEQPPTLSRVAWLAQLAFTLLIETILDD